MQNNQFAESENAMLKGV